MRRKFHVLCLVLILGFAAIVSAQVADPAPTPVLAYEGRLTESSVLVTGTRPFVFSILDSNGNELWNSGPQNLNVVEGLYGIVLGATGMPVIPASLTLKANLHLHVLADGVALSPDISLIPALQASTSWSVTGPFLGDISGTQQGISVDKLKGIPIDLAGLTTGQVLTFDGTSWMPSAAASGQGPQGPAGPAGPTGATGPAGATGSAGATGAMGVTGATGPQGPAGVAGATGAGGTNGTGFNFRNAFLASASYAIDDVATFNGATYVAILASTGPNNPAPNLNPSAWSVMAQEGAAGAAGAAGVQGVQGPAGTAGATGATGVAGATGAIGATGPQGLAGATGATGPTGLQGLQGLVGATGVQGPAGSAGATGAIGAAGPQGLAGATGATGPTGLQGLQGFVGATGPQGPAGSAGATGAIGATGAAGATGPQGLTGATGATGPTGLQGLQGLIGSTGATGATGAAGTNGTGFNFRNTFDASLSYAINDVVIFSGSSYVAIIASAGPPSSTAALDVSSTTKGLLAPRMTTAQRLAIASPANGLIVFDTDTKSLQVYDGVGAIWNGLGAAVGTVQVAGGGTGATTLTGYLLGAGTSAITASATIPGTAISGNIGGSAGNVTGLVAVGHGGTGATSFAQGRILFGTTTTPVAGTVGMFWDSVNSRLGVGTTTPSFPVDIETSVSHDFAVDYGFLSSSDFNFTFDTGNSPYSLYASGRIVANEFDAISDARSKHVIGRSDIASDLDTLKKLRITDYRYIDVVEKGHQRKKGVIAQELEKVYPDAVRITSDFIPSVYAMAVDTLYNEAAHELTVTMRKAHGFATGDMVRIITADTGNLDKPVAAVLNDDTFVLAGVEKDPGQVFVFGKKVDDFHVVDYDQLFSMNIGATQQLAAENQDLRARLAALEEAVALLQQQK